MCGSQASPRAPSPHYGKGHTLVRAVGRRPIRCNASLTLITPKTQWVVLFANPAALVRHGRPHPAIRRDRCSSVLTAPGPMSRFSRTPACRGHPIASQVLGPGIAVQGQMEWSPAVSVGTPAQQNGTAVRVRLRACRLTGPCRQIGGSRSPWSHDVSPAQPLAPGGRGECLPGGADRPPGKAAASRCGFTGRRARCGQRQ